MRQIVIQMEDQVCFDDAPGGGTIFHVDLPAAGQLMRWQAEFAREASALAHDNPPTMARERATGAS